MRDLLDKVVFVAGGSSGLGKSIAKLLAGRGAHVTLFGRSQEKLNKAKDEALKEILDATQEISTVSVDLTDSVQVETAFQNQARLPDILYCVAGGTAAEIGFFTDITAQQIDECMRNNYLTSAYPAHATMKLWRQDDEKSLVSQEKWVTRTRQIIFISSSAVFVNVPGYIAYTPAKCAQRALADTLRQEVQMHSGGISKYSIHCAFPANFWSETFIEEQKSKPQLTKVIESTDRPIEDLQRKLLSAEKIAEHIVEAVMKGDDFIICTDFISSVLFSGMAGPSPKRGWGIVDGMFGVLSNLLVWPMLRRHWRHLSSQAKSTAELRT